VTTEALATNHPPVNLPGAGQPVFRGPHGPVPYIALWSAEDQPDTPVVTTTGGVGYADETADDRDIHGALWERSVSRPGQGEPFYRRVHVRRQRRAMRELLCQVCAGPAAQDRRGALWLLKDERGNWPGWPAGMGNAHPPLCLRCARISVRRCPSLRPGFVAVRAHSLLGGVAGSLYRAGHPRPHKVVEQHVVAHGDPTLRWMVAGQLIRELYDCTVVAR
jgi:hypothetical protein